MGLVAVGDARVGDDDRAVPEVACTARGGFDGDVGGYTAEHEVVDACQAEHGVEFGAVEPVGRLPPDDRFIGPGGDVVDDLDRGSALHQADTVEQGAPQRRVRPDPGEPLLVCDRGVEHLRLGRAEPVQQPCLDPDDPCLLGPAPEELVEGGVDVPGHPLDHMHQHQGGLGGIKATVHVGGYVHARGLHAR